MAPGFSFPPPPPPPPRKQPQAQDFRSSNPQDDSRAPYGRGQDQSWGDNGRGSTGRLPSGSHVNPNFQQRTQQARPGQHDNYRGHTGHSHGYGQHPDRSSAGHKRKLDALRNIGQPRESKPRPQTVPAVPSFGATLSHSTSTLHIASTASISQSPIQKPNKSLFGSGMGTDAPEYSESDEDEREEDDADEEAAYAQLGSKLVFEHEGQIITLTSEQDLARWQEERRKKYPTTDRVAEKEAQRRVIGSERKRLLAPAYVLRRPDWQALIENLKYKDVPQVEEPLHQDVQTPAIKPAGLGLGMYDSEEDDEEPPEEESSKIVDDAEAGSDDEPPEIASSKVAAAIDNRPACKFFFSTGRCKQGEACSYRHEAQSGQPLQLPVSNKRAKPRKVVNRHKSGKKGIHELLVAQENAAADKLALGVIKHLGSIGFFNEPQ